jgi:hypothetical protein
VLRYEFTIDVDHFQLYLQDDQTEFPSRPLGDRAFLDRIQVAPGLIAILTERFGGDTRVEIEVLSDRPDESFDAWDQVVECSIEVPSGVLVLSTSTASLTAMEEPDWPRVRVAPGTYRALVFYGDLDAVDPEDDYLGDDHYRIALWPGELIEPRVLKRDATRYEARLRELRAAREVRAARGQRSRGDGARTGSGGQSATPPRRRKAHFTIPRRTSG